MHEERDIAGVPADNMVILDAGVQQQGLVAETVVPKEVGDGDWRENQWTSRRFS